MLDVEYLLRDPPFQTSLVYRYRTGVMVRRVRQAIERKLGSDRYIERVSPAELMTGLISSALFDNVVQFCDWPIRETRDVRTIADDILGMLTLKPVVIFAPYSSSLFRDPRWVETEGTCMVVEEPVVSLVTLESVLSYLGSASDIRPRPGQDAKLTEYFGRVIEQEGECALTEFVQIFDEALVVHTNASGEFHPPPAGTAEERNRSYILAPLRNLVEGGDPLAANELVKGLERKYRTYVWTVEELLVGLQQATESMLRSPRPRSRRSSFARSEIVEDERDLSRVLWTVALISRTQEGRRLVDSDREELTPHPDLGLATFDLWIRDFVSRDGVRETDNPIPDLWAELSAALDWYAAQSVDRPNPLQKLFVALRTYLERWSSIAGRPNWISRLIYLSEEADRKRDLQSLSRPLR